MTKEKRSPGVIPTLSESQEHVVVGYVVTLILEGKEAQPRTVTDFVLEHFGSTYSEKSAKRLLRRYGFSYRKVQTKSKGFTFDEEVMVDLYFEFVSSIQTEDFVCQPRWRVASIDFTHTSHRTRADHSWAISGG